MKEDFSKLRGLSLKAVTAETSLLVAHLEDNSLLGVVVHNIDGGQYNGMRMVHEYDEDDPEKLRKVEEA